MNRIETAFAGVQAPAIGMALLLDLVLLAAGLVLWQRSSSEGDEVWSLFLRGLAVIDLSMIAIGNGVLWLEIPCCSGPGPAVGGAAGASPPRQPLTSEHESART